MYSAQCISLLRTDRIEVRCEEPWNRLYSGGQYHVSDDHSRDLTLKYTFLFPRAYRISY